MSDWVRLLSTEWLKIKNYKPFWVIFLLYPVCFGGVVGLSLWGQSEVRQVAATKGASAMVEAYLPFAFPHVWQSVSYIGSWLHFIPALLLILNLSNEFSFRSHRQNLLEGWSRPQFLLAKMSLAVAISLYGTALAFLFAVAAGISSGTAPSLEGSNYLAFFFLQSLTFSLFAALLGFQIRRAAMALAAFLIYSAILENILAFCLNLAWKGAGSFLPLEAAGGLIPVPFFKDHAPQAAQALLTGSSQSVLVGITLGYLVAFVAFLWYRFRREDL